MRLWRWLALTAVAFGVLWMLAGHRARSASTRSRRIVFHVVAGFALAAALIVVGPAVRARRASPAEIDGVSSARARRLSPRAPPSWCWRAGTIRLALAAFTALTLATRRDRLAHRSGGRARCRPRQCSSLLVILRWALDPDIEHLIAPSGRPRARSPEPPTRRRSARISRSASASRCCSAPPAFWRRAARSVPIVPMLWSAAAVFTPLADPDRALLPHRRASSARSRSRRLALLLARAVRARHRDARQARRRARARAAASAIFATGAVAALALALTLALEKGWLTVALALMVPGIAWMPDKRPLPMLRWLAAAIGRAGAGAHRLGAAHRRQRRRHDADLQLAALRLRHSRRRVLARRPSAAPARRRRAGAHGRFRRASCSPCCSPSWKSATS